MKFNKRYLILLLLIISIPSVLYLFFGSFVESDDGEWMVIRFSAFYQAMADGQIPARFLHRLNFGYGYPVANFLYPGFMYLGLPIKLLGFGFVDTIKILFAASMLLSGVFTFYWLRKLFGDIASFFASIYYVYAPYHLFDLYVRGSLGEMLAFLLAPFILWQIARKSLLWISIGVGLLLLSHNILAAMFMVVIAFYMLLIIIFAKKDKLPLTKTYIFSIIAGIGIAAFFVLPALYELKYVVFSNTVVSEWGKYFADYKVIGVSTLLIIFLSCIFIFLKRRYQKYKLTILMLVIAVVSLFLSIEASAFVWEIIPVSFIQFPFRFLSVTILISSFLAAFLLSLVARKQKIIFGFCLIFITIIFSFPYLINTEVVDKGEGFYATNEATTTVADEYLPLWVGKKPTEHFSEKVQIIEGEAIIQNVYYDNKTIKFSSNSEAAIAVRINTIYYPGFEASIDAAKTDIKYENEYGVMDIMIPAGTHEVELRFNETPFRTFANTISLISLFAVLIYSGRSFIFRPRKQI